MQQEEENKRLRDENLRIRDILIFSILSIVLLVFIVALVVVNDRKSRKNVRLLTQLNETIRLQKKELEATLDQLEQRNKDKDHLMRIVAHDLRNPLAGIYSLTGLMMEDMIEGSTLKNNTGVIHKSAGGTLALITEMLESANNDQGLMHEVKTRGDIYELITHCVELLRFKALEKKQVVKWTSPGGTLLVKMDPNKLWRVLNNILINAIKFSGTGKTIDVSTNVDGNEIEVSVKDEGVGIPPELSGKIFDMYSGAKRSGTSGERAYGLGMSISKKIMQDFGGDIYFTSKEGEGTTFCIRVPLEKNGTKNRR